MTTRRNLLKQIAAASAASIILPKAFASNITKKESNDSNAAIELIPTNPTINNTISVLESLLKDLESSPPTADLRIEYKFNDILSEYNHISLYDVNKMSWIIQHPYILEQNKHVYKTGLITEINNCKDLFNKNLEQVKSITISHPKYFNLNMWKLDDDKPIFDYKQYGGDFKALLQHYNITLPHNYNTTPYVPMDLNDSFVHVKCPKHFWFDKKNLCIIIRESDNSTIGIRKHSVDEESFKLLTIHLHRLYSYRRALLHFYKNNQLSADKALASALNPIINLNTSKLSLFIHDNIITRSHLKLGEFT